ncbi:MAG: hypothetical protein HUU55_22035 [Myxococcales bacterium]|nr:hypothetical protein [Myxococcales bacterium]
MNSERRQSKSTYARPVEGLMRISGLTYAQIARELGVSKSLVSKVILGQRNNAEIESALCVALDLPFSRLSGNADAIEQAYVRKLTEHELKQAQSRIESGLALLQSATTNESRLE